MLQFWTARFGDFSRIPGLAQVFAGRPDILDSSSVVKRFDSCATSSEAVARLLIEPAG